MFKGKGEIMFEENLRHRHHALITDVTSFIVSGWKIVDIVMQVTKHFIAPHTDFIYMYRHKISVRKLTN